MVSEFKENHPDKLDEVRDDHGEKLDRLEEKVNALSENVEQLVEQLRVELSLLEMDVKGIRDQIGMYHGRDKAEIDEIKTHLELPLISDISEV